MTQMVVKHPQEKNKIYNFELLEINMK